jgi:hypothetical protein
MKRHATPAGRETGGLVAAVGGIVLLVSLFVAWYTLPGVSLTAWRAFEVWDLVLAAIAIAVVLSVATDLGWWRGPLPGMRLPTLGAAAVVIVASQLVDRPPSAVGSAIGSGGWLGLIGAAAIAVGALIADSRLTVSFDPARPADPAAAGTPPPGRWTAARRPRRPGSVQVDPDVAGTPVAAPRQAAAPDIAAPRQAAAPDVAGPRQAAAPDVAGPRQAVAPDPRQAAAADVAEPGQPALAEVPHPAPGAIDDETVRIVPVDPPPPRRA